MDHVSDRYCDEKDYSFMIIFIWRSWAGFVGSPLGLFYVDCEPNTCFVVTVLFICLVVFSVLILFLLFC